MSDTNGRNKSTSEGSSKPKDTLCRTLRKIPWGGILGDATLELVPKGAGFAVSLVGIPGAGEIVGRLTKRVLEYTLRRFTHLYEKGEVTLSEVFGRTIPDKQYQGVGDFWAKVIRDNLAPNSLIEISGLLSPYGPLMPAHPMARPGYTIQGWEAIGDLGVEDTEEYDTRDGFIYGDRVIHLSTPRNNKYYAGLYDPYFGISNVSLPLYVDKDAIRAKNMDLRALWEHPMTGGNIVRLKGRLKEIPSFYSQFVNQLPAPHCSLPSFGLEVFEIKPVTAPNGVTHMAVTVSWKKRNEERMITHYFNVQDKSQFEAAEYLLEDGRDRHSKSLLFNYDDLTCFSPNWKHKIPEYNEMLRPWLEGSEI